jgi:CRP-like cAMP-binding protein
VEKISLIKRRKMVAAEAGRGRPRDEGEISEEQESSDADFYIDEMDLKNIYLLNGIELESVIGVLDVCAIRELEPQEILIAPDTPNRTVFFILAGRLRIHLDSPGTQPTAVLDPGESVGEISVVDHKPASVYIIADTPCTLLAMEEDTLWSLVKSSHMVARNLLFALVKKLRHADAVFPAV